MKALLIGEYREGKLLDSTYELLGFASQLAAETALLLVGGETGFRPMTARSTWPRRRPAASITRTGISG